MALAGNLELRSEEVSEERVVEKRWIRSRSGDLRGRNVYYAGNCLFGHIRGRHPLGTAALGERRMWYLIESIDSRTGQLCRIVSGTLMRAGHRICQNECPNDDGA